MLACLKTASVMGYSAKQETKDETPPYVSRPPAMTMAGMANRVPTLPMMKEAMERAAPVMSMTLERMVPSSSIRKEDCTKPAKPVM